MGNRPAPGRCGPIPRLESPSVSARRTPLHRLLVAVVSAGLLVTMISGCGTNSSSSPAGGSGPAASSAAAPATGQITVFAAASLKATFGTLARQFEAANPGTTVTLSFAASSALATQIAAGAPADVFAAASTKTMQTVVDAGAAGSPTVFATNVMEVAVPPGNPGGVTQLSDLTRPGVKVALCQDQVPCGVAAQQVFTKAKLTVTPVTLEPDVTSVLSKVTLGEVDAGMVYVTDVKGAAGKVSGVEIPAGVNATTTYPIAALTKSANAATAQAFVSYVLSPAGRSVLSAAGFGAP